MKLYLTKHGVAHVELTLDEITDLKMCLAIGNRTFAGERPRVAEMDQRIGALVTHWLDGGTEQTRPDPLASGGKQTPATGKPPATPGTPNPGSSATPSKQTSLPGTHC